MRSTRFATVLLVLACAGCATSPPRTSGSATTHETQASPQELVRIQTQDISNAFARQIEIARKSALGPAPVVVVENTPQLVSFQYETNSMTVPTWTELPDQVKSVFRKFSGGNEAETEQFFQSFFNRFLIAHEASHWFQYKT